MAALKKTHFIKNETCFPFPITPKQNKNTKANEIKVN